MKTQLALTLLTVARGWAAPAASPQPAYPVVTPGQEFRFPRDHGSHPAYRTEWWYFTGWLDGPDGRPIEYRSPTRDRYATMKPEFLATQRPRCSCERRRG